MRWFIVLLLVVLVAVAVLTWARARGRRLDEGQVRDLRESAAARKRLDEHRNPTEGSAGSGSGGGWV
ncbi:hypothetical protein Q3W71_18350 [Micromonospora sp. C28SCA-DRY-2]|uniref:hypothetical protein n=1 Tax=Micromonospora sp. C28SCA-DRY-2 TaxID=3059522 RepID=UPI0026770100|nr:hypothetical protein [Micromonospora sp. C28SCA-DRY-2]MDO3703629.1 hypothetical protein [Micromonospora sp. C28SCA-DRY-2]